MDSTLLSHGAYARSKGWSQQYVSQLVAKGKIPNVDGKIDPVAADKALAANADPRKSAVRRANAERRDGDEGDDADLDGMSQNDAQTERIRVQIKRERLAYQKEVHEVVEITALRSGLADLIAVAANQLQTIPDRIAERAAATSDMRAVHAMIDAEIVAVQQQIADAGNTLIERLTATSQ